MTRFKPARKSAQSGFTLLEVLVAVAILALGMSAFLTGSSRYADNARYIQQKSLALWVARNQLVELQLVEPWPDEGRDEGEVKMGEQQWEWRSNIEETPDPRVRKMEITVFPAQGGASLGDDETPLATLTGYVSPKDGSVSETIDPEAIQQLQNQGVLP